MRTIRTICTVILTETPGRDRALLLLPNPNLNRTVSSYESKAFVCIFHCYPTQSKATGFPLSNAPVLQASIGYKSP